MVGVAAAAGKRWFSAAWKTDTPEIVCLQGVNLWCVNDREIGLTFNGYVQRSKSDPIHAAVRRRQWPFVARRWIEQGVYECI